MVAGVVTAALAGCGTTVVATGASGNTTNTGTGSTATGCSSVSLATKVTVIRSMHLIEPQRAKDSEHTQTNKAKVQTLFRDFCQAIAHKETKSSVLHCPDQIGLSYGGAFYDGSRLLASYSYAASGCQRVSVTAPGGKPQSVVVWGTAAAAAPHLGADLAKVLNQPQSTVIRPYTGSMNGGGNN